MFSLLFKNSFIIYFPLLTLVVVRVRRLCDVLCPVELGIWFSSVSSFIKKSYSSYFTENKIRVHPNYLRVKEKNIKHASQATESNRIDNGSKRFCERREDVCFPANTTLGFHWDNLLSCTTYSLRIYIFFFFFFLHFITLTVMVHELYHMSHYTNNFCSTLCVVSLKAFLKFVRLLGFSCSCI